RRASGSGLRGAAGSGLAAPAALLAVALHLPGELVRAEVDRVLEVRGGLARAERGALQVERSLDDLVVRDRGVLLDLQLDVELGQVRHLLRHAAEAVLDVGAEG